jgi:hypothetical protein
MYSLFSFCAKIHFLTFVPVVNSCLVNNGGCGAGLCIFVSSGKNNCQPGTSNNGGVSSSAATAIGAGVGGGMLFLLVLVILVFVIRGRRQRQQPLPPLVPGELTTLASGTVRSSTSAAPSSIGIYPSSTLKDDIILPPDQWFLFGRAPSRNVSGRGASWASHPDFWEKVFFSIYYENISVYCFKN